MKQIRTLNVINNMNYIGLYLYEKVEDILECFIDESTFIVFLNIYFEEKIVSYFELNKTKEYKRLISVYSSESIHLYTSPNNKNQLREHLKTEPWDFSCVVLTNRNNKLELEYIIRQVENDVGCGITIKELCEGNFNRRILPRIKKHFNINEFGE